MCRPAYSIASNLSTTIFVNRCDKQKQGDVQADLAILTENSFNVVLFFQKATDKNRNDSVLKQ